MIRYTTPTLTFNLPFEVSYLSDAYVTIVQSNKIIEKSYSDCTVQDKTLSVTLTQEETGSLVAERDAKVQLRCKGTDGKAYASQEFQIKIDDVLKSGAI